MKSKIVGRKNTIRMTIIRIIFRLSHTKFQTCRSCRSADTVKGIIIGASGQGGAMVANKFPHVRAAVYYGYGLEQGKHDHKREEMQALTAMRIIELSRLHNDANILSSGAKFMDENEAKAAVKLWLNTPFSGEARHRRRLDEMEKISAR